MSEKPSHLLPSRTQRKIYKALFRIRLAGYRHMHKAEARASGGLSDKERLAMRFQRGYWTKTCDNDVLLPVGLMLRPSYRRREANSGCR